MVASCCLTPGCCPLQVSLLPMMQRTLGSLLHNASLLSMFQQSEVHSSSDWAHVMQALLSVLPRTAGQHKSAPQPSMMVAELKAGSMLAYTSMPGASNTSRL